jgi:hypothetical protein
VPLAKVPDRIAAFVLVVLAEHADAAGAGAFPSVGTVATETRTSVRAVQKALRQLEAADLITRDGVGPHGVTRWRLACTPAGCAPPQAVHPAQPAPPPRTPDTGGMHPVHQPPAQGAPEPPENRQRTQEEEERASAPEHERVVPPILDELRDLLTADALRLAWDDLAVFHVLEAHAWTADGDLRAAARAVASWAAQSTDGPRFRHAARLLRTELEQMDARRKRPPRERTPGSTPPVAGPQAGHMTAAEARRTAPQRVAEMRRLAAIARAEEEARTA